MKKKVVSFLSSGLGTLFSVSAKKIISKKINAELGILISNKKHAKALERAKNYGMKSFYINPAKYSTREDYDRELVKLLAAHKTDLVVAAGYMLILSPYFINKFRNRIINIHPSLLPSFQGTKAQKKAFDYGVKITGCTCHFIDEGVDTGPIIMQSPVEINAKDTMTSLSLKIREEEYKILPESIKLFCEDKLKIIGKKIIIKN